MIIALAIVYVLGFTLATGLSITVAQGVKDGWLGCLAPDEQTEALERQLRGFDMAMVEVGYRYTEMYFGAIEGNWEYALYAAEKMGAAIEDGLERRPKRRPNAEAIFLARRTRKRLSNRCRRRLLELTCALRLCSSQATTSESLDEAHAQANV